MGAGGYLQMVNATSYTWRRLQKYDYTYQVPSFNVADKILPGQTDTTYVEFQQSIGTTQSDSEAKAVYILEGTQYRVRIYVSGDPNNIQVRLEGFSTPTLSDSQWLDLGFDHNGQVAFVLSGSGSSFTSSDPSPNWMQSSLSRLGSRFLRQICMPGSHDSGMSTVDCTGFAGINPGMMLTQDYSIHDQLIRGARYFDIRPVANGSAFATGHFSKVGILGWQGGYGQSIASIIQDINNFTNNNKELIIVNISHGYDAEDDFSDLSQAQWYSLFDQFAGIHSLWKSPSAPDANLTTLSLSSFIAGGSAAVLIRFDIGDVSLGSYAGKGFFSQAALPLFDDYSDTEDVNTMTADQLQKLRDRSKGVDSLQLLSWTLTASSLDSVKPLAQKANKALFADIYTQVSPSAFPNILSVDYLTASVGALAVAINDKAGQVAAPVYVSSVYSITQGDSDEEREDERLHNIDGGRVDINAGFKGDYSYLYVTHTLDPNQAITDISIAVQSDSRGNGQSDMANNAGGDYRYVDYSSDADNARKITDVAFWRSGDAKTIEDVQAQGWDGMTTDINAGRGGDYIYVIWKTSSA